MTGARATVTRTRLKLEKEGYIREYTIIPDFSKLGYNICAFTFAKFETAKDLTDMIRAIQGFSEKLSEIPQAILIERGQSSEADGVVVVFHESYSEFTKFRDWLRQFSVISTYKLNTFIIDLTAGAPSRYLTFKTLAKHLLSIYSETK